MELQDPKKALEHRFPVSHAFIIGINGYRNGVKPLTSAIKDAEDMAELFGTIHGYTVHPPAYDATKEDIYKVFEKMKTVVKSGHRVLFYFAGHGYASDSETNPKGWLVPADAQKDVESSLVPMDDLHDIVKNLECNHGLLILDCCFSGSFKWSTTRGFDLSGDKPMYYERFKRFIDRDAWQVITSAAHDQKAIDIFGHQAIGMRDAAGGEAEEIPNSPFAKALKKAINLEGAADASRSNRSDGIITATELYTYLRDIVETETAKQKHEQTPSIFTLNRHKKGEFIFLHPGHRLNLPKAPDSNPYKGLGSFEKTDAELFFGREEAIRKMAEKLEDNPILVVSAPSGQGKSSTIKAGLFPYLQKRSGYDTFLTMRPGTAPFSAFEKVEFPKTDKPYIFLVDKFEEFFADAEYSQSHEDFEAAMTKLLEKAEKGHLKIILSIRSDFEWQLKGSDFGVEFWNDQEVRRFLYRLPPMSKDDLRQMMLKPAWMIAYDFQSDELVEEILEEIENSPGALPLLSFTLNKLYENKDDINRIFTEKAYREKLKGINGALSTMADEAYLAFETDEERKVLEIVFLRMINLNDGSYSSRRVYYQYKDKDESINELDFPDHLDETVETVLNKLVEKNLVRGSKDQIGLYYEPMHNALINYWPRGLQWIKNFKKENIKLQRQLWQAVLETPRGSKKANTEESATLEIGPELIPVEAYEQKPAGHVSTFWDTNPKLSQVIESLIDPCTEILKNGDPNHPLNMAIDAISKQLEGNDKWKFYDLLNECHDKGKMPNLDAFILSGVSDQLLDVFLDKSDHWLNELEVWFIKESWSKRTEDILQLKKDKEDAVKAKNEAQASLLTVKALAKLEKDPTIALNLAFEAYKKVPNEDVVTAFSQISHPDLSYYKERYKVGSMTGLPIMRLSKDGRWCLIVYAVFAEPEKAVLIDLWHHKVLPLSFQGRYLSGGFDEESPLTVVLSDDGTFFLYALQEGIFHFDIKADKSKKLIDSKYQWEVSSLALLNDKNLYTGTVSGEIHLWSLEENQEDPLRIFKGHTDYVLSIALSENGETFVSGSLDGSVKLWDVNTESPKSTLMSQEHSITSIDFSPNGKYVVSGDDEGLITRFEIGKDKSELFREGHDEMVHAICFSPDGKQFLSAGADNKVLLWDTSNPQKPKRIFPNQPSAVFSTTFLPNGEEFITASADPIIWKGVMQDTADADSGQTEVTIWPTNSSEDLFTYKTKENGTRVFPIPNSSDVMTFSEDQGRTVFKSYFYGYAKPDIWVPEPRIVTRCAKVSQDGRHLISGNLNGSIVLWEMWPDKNGKIIKPKDGNAIEQIEISFNGNYVVFIAKDKKLRLWHVPSASEVDLPEEMRSGFDEPCFSQDEKYLIVGNHGGKDKDAAIIYDIPAGKIIRKIPPVKEADLREIPSFEVNPDSDGFTYNGFRGFAFSPDNKYYAGTLSLDPDIVRIWDTDSGELVVEIKEPHLLVTSSIDFSSDSKIVMTSGYMDKKVKLWDMNSGQLIREFGGTETPALVLASFIRSDEQIVAIYEDGTVYCWHNPLHSWDNRIYRLSPDERKTYKID